MHQYELAKNKKKSKFTAKLESVTQQPKEPWKISPMPGFEPAPRSPAGFCGAGFLSPPTGTSPPRWIWLYRERCCSAGSGSGCPSRRRNTRFEWESYPSRTLRQRDGRLMGSSLLDKRDKICKKKCKFENVKCVMQGLAIVYFCIS